MSKKLIFSVLILLHITSPIMPIEWPSIPDFFKKTVYVPVYFQEEPKSIPQKISQFWNNLKDDTKAQIILWTALISTSIILSKYQLNNFISNEFCKLHPAGTIDVTFDDVAGNHEAKEELQDIVQYLKNPSKYHAIGAKVPKGILLTGEPGTGKTLLAKALAGEANCAFISCSGSDFHAKYYSVGKDRIKQLFKEARKYTACIIFIDEIDSLLFKRSDSSYSADQDNNATINKFLTEIDGFESRNAHESIIVIGATNNPDSLDPAALRPGRFDRIVKVSLPELSDRKKILQIHLNNIKHDQSINIQKIAQDTAGFSGADLANYVNTAAINAVNNNRSIVTMQDFEDTLHKIEQSDFIKNNASQSHHYFKVHQAGTIKTTFSDVAGNHEVKDELKDIIDYLKYPEKYTNIGAKVPKGILLTGNPGTGKTLLARALAGEANCSFISCSGSEFVEIFVGQGAQNIRKLFKEAKKNGPCIIFIDEIDALAFKRSSNGSGGDSEYNQTINQLLTEMDGFATCKSDKHRVIVIGATNNPDLLDPAVLRPGRFDRIVKVPLPDVTCREEILKVYLNKITHNDNIDAKKIAQVTPGFSGAELESLVNEAAINTINQNRQVVEMQDFEDARDKVMLGSKSKTIKLTQKDKQVTAYHEAGHTLILLLMPNQSNTLNKVTIIPQGQALGVTHALQEIEKYGYSQKELLAYITMTLGGRAAEELVFNEITTGASGDFQIASKTARAMICEYGMTDIIGKQVLMNSKKYSEETLKKIDEGVTKILEDQYKVAMNILKTNRDKLDKLAHALLEKETLFAHEVYELLGITPKTDFRLG